MGFRISTGLGPVRFNTPITGGMVAVVLGLCCVGGVVNAFNGDDDKKPESSSEVSQAPGFVTNRSFTPLPTTKAPSPSRKPSPKASVKPTPKPSPKRTTARPKPVRTTHAPTTDKQYGTCKEANAHGLGPYYRGKDPEYYWYDDRDGDGIVCER